MSKLNQFYVMGVPVGTYGYTPGTGYLSMPCGKCGRSCWVGPLGRQQLRRPNSGGIRCGPCAVQLKLPTVSLNGGDDAKFAPQPVLLTLALWHRLPDRPDYVAIQTETLEFKGDEGIRLALDPERLYRYGDQAKQIHAKVGGMAIEHVGLAFVEGKVDATRLKEPGNFDQLEAAGESRLVLRLAPPAETGGTNAK